MKKKHAKKLRELAIGVTVGKTNKETRRVYKQLKRVHKSLKREEKIK